MGVSAGVEPRQRDPALSVSDVTRRLVDAGVVLSSAASLDEVLQELVDAARDLVEARYAALGVIDETGAALSNFITSGLDAEQRARLGALPTGHGILGLLIRDARPIRLRDLQDHPDSVGVPKEHPPMHSFLGVPIRARNRVFGNLYVTEKKDEDEFSDYDLSILEMLAAQAAVAIENAQLRRERERFFAAVSHELGNAIAGVSLWARQLLQRSPRDPELWAQGVASIRKGAEDAERLIEDLLSISEIRENRLRIREERVNLVAALDELIDRFQPDGATATRATPTLEICPTTPPHDVHVEGDTVRVRQILINLIGNAIKFTPPDGTVTLGIELEEDQVVSWVGDTGPGIEEADLERIFLPYEQVQGVARGRGIGLGLPLSRKLAQLMGGDLRAESTPGEGTTFRLLLPAAPSIDEV